MESIFAYLAAQPVLMLFIIVGVGMRIGKINFKGLGLGAAAVLFLAIAVSALGNYYNQKIVLPHEFGLLGLALFAYAIGINSGRSFFSTMRKSLGPILSTFVVLVLAGATAFGLGKLCGFDSATIGGIFAGATTNTPALAAAGKSSGAPDIATVAYSITYLFGVIGMIIAANMALSYRKNDSDTPDTLVSQTIYISHDIRYTVEELEKRLGNNLQFSRIYPAMDSKVYPPEPSTLLKQGDLVTVVGTKNAVAEITHDLGKTSEVKLEQDREFIDYRRITISNPKISGLRIDELHLWERYQAIISRVRRGDNDEIGRPDLVLQLGDRVRVVAPRENLSKLTRFFGDSSSGFYSLNPIALGMGMALGILIGELPILTPSGAYFSIGSAAGTLIMGLIFGRIGRIGKFPTTMPYTSCQVLAELGLLVFLAQAGSNAGGQIAKAFTSGTWVSIMLVGFAVTTVLAVGLYLVMRFGFGMGGTRLSGLLGGTQTQPAVLAFSNNRTGNDPRVALGYAMVYPMAMVTKILIAQILGGL